MGKLQVFGAAASAATAFTADDVHTALAGLGMTPVFGIVFDGTDVIFYIVEGRLEDAGKSALAMPPVFGQLARAGDAAIEIASKGGRELKILDATKAVEHLHDAERTYEIGEFMPDGRRAGWGPGTPASGQGPGVSPGTKYGVNDPPVRIEGNWTDNDMKQALLGHPPRGLGSPDLHHADQMPGSGIHEILPSEHSNPALHPNKYNQGVTPEMRESDRKLHWWYRAREQGADERFPEWIYDK